jgi:hypothetical protein
MQTPTGKIVPEQETVAVAVPFTCALAVTSTSPKARGVMLKEQD